MKKVTSIKEAEKLLQEIQDKIRKNGVLFLNYKRKNSQTLAMLGITASHLEKIFYGIRATDYCGGPESDERYVWKSVSVFGVIIKGLEVYVKFSVGQDEAPVVCLSFHEAERPMTYQFK
jgi:hypothetical protein